LDNPTSAVLIGLMSAGDIAYQRWTRGQETQTEKRMATRSAFTSASLKQKDDNLRIKPIFQLSRAYRKQFCLFAAVSAAMLLPEAGYAQSANLIFQVTPSDFNPDNRGSDPDVGPTGTLTASGAVSIQTNATPSGASSLVFNGTAGSPLASQLPDSTNNFTIFAVVLPNASSSPETIIAGAPGSLQYRIDEQGSVNAGEQAFLNRDQFQFGNSSAVVDQTKFSLIDATLNPNNSAPPNGVIFTNNGVVTGDPGGTGFNVGSITAFGAGDNGNGTFNEFFNGQIAELQVYNVSMGTAARQAVEANLLAQFGLTSNLFNWTAGTGFYSTASNWDQNAVPNNLTYHLAVIANGGTAQIVPGDEIGLNSFHIGDNTNPAMSGNVIQTGGDLTISNDFAIGNNQTLGTYNMSGGTITYNGPGLFSVRGSTSLAPSVLNLSGNASITATAGGSVALVKERALVSAAVMRS
jgi:hypothetical protein